jgi:hypothetical protein
MNAFCSMMVDLIVLRVDATEVYMILYEWGRCRIDTVVGYRGGADIPTDTCDPTMSNLTLVTNLT